MFLVGIFMLLTSPFNIHSRQIFTFKSASYHLSKVHFEGITSIQFFGRDSNLEFLSMYVDRNSGLCVCVLANFRPDNHAWCGDVVPGVRIRCRMDTEIYAAGPWGLCSCLSGDFLSEGTFSRRCRTGLWKSELRISKGARCCRYIFCCLKT